LRLSRDGGPTGSRWAIVLAGGDGTRLRPLTTDDAGTVVPKQFCSLSGGPSLLEAALARAERPVPRDRVLRVVAADHERFWREQLAHLPPQNVFRLACNRGTALGLFLPLLFVLNRDPEASVVVLPADHHVEDEAILAASLRAALDDAVAGESGVVLLGMSPQDATADYGWIIPAGPYGATRAVSAFVEKPGAVRAGVLRAQGALWNTFLFAGRARVLRDLIERHAGAPARELASAVALGGDAVDRVYEVLEPVDLSHDVFAKAPAALRVLEVPQCGWTDLGTPQRVRACLAQRRPGTVERPLPRLRLDVAAARMASA